jgi:hypothetical protein
VGVGGGVESTSIGGRATNGKNGKHHRHPPSLERCEQLIDSIEKTGKRREHRKW